MKRGFVCLLAVLTIVAAQSGCGQEDASDAILLDGAEDFQKFHVIATIFPPYDWVKEIVGDATDRIEISLLLQNGVDLHSYQPTAEDIVKLSTCDMFLYNGGESDGWVEDALKSSRNNDMIVINLLDVLGDAVKDEEMVAGMEREDSHTDGHLPRSELDEHVWLSLQNAQIICGYIAGKLSELDPENAEAYLANAQTYNTELDRLDLIFREVVAGAAHDTLLFADRFPFRYFVDDYGLNYYAAFPGCSAETEASFETIIFLAAKVDELALTSVLVTESSDQSIARAVIENTAGRNQNILTLNSAQSVTEPEIQAGVTYLSLMESNLNAFKKALN